MILAKAVLAGAVGVAIVAPIIALTDHRRAPPPAPAAAAGPIVPSPAVSLDAAIARPLFNSGATSALPDASPAQGTDSEGAPQVVGIVGRLPDQAVVLVRRASGGTRTIGIGDDVDGWRLVSIAADAVLFEQGNRRARIDVTAGEPADQ